ncbi:ISAs1 family transposase [Microcoleus sp. D2_18a_D3]|uniref:ISAs1 family transposase n=1 Tax=Microcoleus sp. D2_18a_D3 TaxID=3055330 RepID=UPI002FD02B17
MDKGFLPARSRSKLLKKPSPISMQELQGSLSSYFDDVPDPRVNRTKRHLLKDILVIAILSTIAGGDGWEDMENYGISKQQWLQKFLDLPNGIPSDDTFRRVFEKVDPKVLEQKLTEWVKQLIGPVVQQVIPIDGKSIRGSYDRKTGENNLHLVTAWASENRLVLGQVKVENHSNEITAIPALLELIDVTGAIITMDAMGTQTEIVRLIRQKKADYVVTLKKNHPTLYKQVKTWFETARAKQFWGIEVSEDSRTEKAHHRIETRKVGAVPVGVLGGLYKQEDWTDIQTIVIVERFRYLWNKTTHEVQFYLSSLPVDAQLNGRVIRQHWSIENQEHWVLDVTFNEDRSRIRSLNSPRNLAVIRRMSLNAVNQETTLKRSLRQKRKRAAMNDEYMMLLLKSFCQG